MYYIKVYAAADNSLTVEISSVSKINQAEFITLENNDTGASFCVSILCENKTIYIYNLTGAEV